LQMPSATRAMPPPDFFAAQAMRYAAVRYAGACPENPQAIRARQVRRAWQRRRKDAGDVSMPGNQTNPKVQRNGKGIQPMPSHMEPR